MCGRFALYSSVQSIMKYADELEAAQWQESYNIAPTQQVPVVVQDGSKRIARMLRWGLVPFWARDVKIGARMINARAETISDKPSFKYAFQKRRCLVPADGFYEWRKPDKQPFYVRGSDNQLLWFAGLWERWKQPDGSPLDSFTIITTQATGPMLQLHHRMPVMLNEASAQLWMQSHPSWIDLHKALNTVSVELVMHPVSSQVNSTANNHPRLIQPQAS
jgi:putative SOS response-associated peptidase YedK